MKKDKKQVRMSVGASQTANSYTEIKAVMPRPTLREQCGSAVLELMKHEDISFTKMAKMAKMTHDKLFWYIIGDRRGSPEKDMDDLEAIGKVFGGWVGPKFVLPKKDEN